MTAMSEALEAVLDAALAGYTAADLTPPTRAYISPGRPPADCELLAVWGVPRAKEGMQAPGRSSTSCAVIHQAQISVLGWINTCATGTPPDRDALHAAGIRLADEHFAVWRELVHRMLNKTLVDGASCPGAQALNTSQVSDEAGGFIAWQIDVDVDLTPLLTPTPTS